MDDSNELAYDAERLKALERFSVALPRPIGETPARTIARLYPMIVLIRLSGRSLPRAEEDMCSLAGLPGDSEADGVARAGLRGIETLLVVEEAYRACPLPERPFWSPIQTWVATVGACELPEISNEMHRSWIERCVARARTPR